MTKREAIVVLKDLIERLQHVPDSYDSETDICAIEMGIECIEESIRLDEFLKPCGYKREILTKEDKIESTDFDIFKEVTCENE